MEDIRSKEIIKIAKELIPSQEIIIEEVLLKLGLKKKFVEKNFSKTLTKFDKEGNVVFKTYQKLAFEKLAELWLREQGDDVRRRFLEINSEKNFEKFIEKATKLFSDFAELVQKLELDLGNMRKSRGGGTFQRVVLKMLNFINIPCETPTGKKNDKLNRIDIVGPSINVALKKPDTAFFLSCKRTLRERWKQEVPQVKLNQRTYLVTLDMELSENKANEINEKQMIAFLPDEVASHDKFKKSAWIRKLSDLPKYLK